MPLRLTCTSVGEFVSSAMTEFFTRPKSRIFGVPSLVTMMFSGFRSRCTSAAACAAASPSATPTAIDSNFFSATGPRPMISRSESPRISSITSQVSPSRELKSWMVTMFRWLSAEALRASRSKRARRSRSLVSSCGRTLMATSRPSRVSRARYTSPIPPAPMGPEISYGPSRAPDSRRMCTTRITE